MKYLIVLAALAASCAAHAEPSAAPSPEEIVARDMIKFGQLEETIGQLKEQIGQQALRGQRAAAQLREWDRESDAEQDQADDPAKAAPPRSSGP